jgi:asparagine synthase (glutamine-hydrolysing)
MSLCSWPLALGHVRLAINDLSPCGDQPLHSPDGLVHAIVNGEIYDYDKLRALNPEYPYVGHSDSELVVALYLQSGQSFLSHLRGEFSLVIFDQRDGSFFAARDRYGIKPLFWTRQRKGDGDGDRVEQIWVGAEIKAFLGLGWEPEWDVGSIVTGGWGQDTRTTFKGVQKVGLLR